MKKINKLLCTLFLLCGIASVSQAQTCTVNAGINQTGCLGSNFFLSGNFSINNSDVSTFLWTVVSQPAGSAVVIDNPGSLNTPISNITVAGTYIFQAQVACSGGLGVATQTVTYTVLNTPTEPVVNDYNVGCFSNQFNVTLPGAPVGTTVTIAAIGGVLGSFLNSSTSNQGAFVTTFVPDPPTSCSSVYETEVLYTVTNIATGCSASTVFSIFHTPIIPVTADHSYSLPDTTIIQEEDCIVVGGVISGGGPCAGLIGSCPTNGTGLWTYSGPGTASFAPGATTQNSNVCVSTLGTYTFTWTVTGGCGPGTASTTVEFVPEVTTTPDSTITADPVTAGDNLFFCVMPNSISLQGSPLGVTQTGLWTQTSGPAAIIVSPTTPNTVVQGLQPNNNYSFNWTVCTGNCCNQASVAVSEITDLYWTPTDGCTGTYFAGQDFEPAFFDTLLVTYTLIDYPADYPAYYLQNSSSPSLSTSYTPITCIGCVGMPEEVFSGGVVPPNQTYTYHINQLNINNPNFDGLHLNLPLSPLMIGTFTYNIQVWNGCETQQLQLSNTITPNPGTYTPLNAGSDAVMPCGISSVTLTGNSVPFNSPSAPLTQWEMISGPTGAPNPFNASNNYGLGVSSLILNGLQNGAYIFRYHYILPNTPCITPSNYSDDVLFVVSSSGLPSTPTASVLETSICAGGGNGTATLIGNGSNGLGTWSLITQTPSGTAPIIQSPTAATSPVASLQPNTTYTFRYTLANGCGSSFADVTFSTNSNVPPSNAVFTGSTNCIATGSLAFINYIVPAVGTHSLSFLSQPAGSAATITNPGNGSATTTLSVPGQYAILLQVVNSPCTQAEKDTLYIYALPPTPLTTDAGIDRNYCGVTLPYIAPMAPGSTPSNMTGTWTQLSGPVATIANSHSPNTNITYSVSGVYRFQWTITYASGNPSPPGCASVSDNVEIVIGDAPPFASAGIDQTHCGGSNVFTLDALDIAPGVGSGVWSKISGSPFVTFFNQHDPNTTVTLSTEGTALLAWTAIGAANSCGSNQDVVSVTWIEPADAGTDQSLCEAGSATLTGNIPAVGTTVLWSKLSGSGTQSFSQATNYTTVVSGLISPGTYTFAYTKTAGTCISVDTVVVTVETMPFPFAGNNDTICVTNINAPLNIPLMGSSLPTGIRTWTLVAKPFGASVGNLSTTGGTTAAYTASSSVLGDYLFDYTVNNGFCEKTDRVKISVIDCSSLPCNLTSVGMTVICDTSQQYQVTVNPTGVGLATTYTATFGSSTLIGTYNTPLSFTIPQSGSPVVVTIEDNGTSACSLTASATIDCTGCNPANGIWERD